MLEPIKAGTPLIDLARSAAAPDSVGRTGQSGG